ncbi:hypothetical protein LPJ61_000636 [Coemansia biformis]|uniref:FAD-binding FR-type domain-containing protein n=1 Tax=Coemansia biformis TaxID=1286918 RepID=A0A9W7YJ94_9FUNG|nr:hypothetical protein LPJ61_000636 [Coemansia biformis]
MTSAAAERPALASPAPPDSLKAAGHPAPNAKAALRRLLDPAAYPEITLRRTAFFCAWFVPHIIIVAYYGASGRGIARKRLDNAAIASMLFDVAAILVFMSPMFLMAVRRALPRFIVIEKGRHAHKVAAYTLTFWSIVHIGANYSKYASRARPLVESLFYTRTGATGHALAFSLFLIIITAIPPVRRRLFEVFYCAHHLFVPFVVVLFFHHRNLLTYKYLSGPLAIYTVDRIYRTLRSALAKSPIRAVVQHPSGVVELQLDKRIVGHHVGQYVKVCCPSVSPLQWHALTISSAPEEDLLTVHFRVCGGWTRSFAERLGCSVDADSKSLAGLQPADSTQDTETTGVGPIDIAYHPLHHGPVKAPFYSQAGCSSSYVSIDTSTKGGGVATRTPRHPDCKGPAEPAATIYSSDGKKAGSELVPPSRIESGDVAVRGASGLPMVLIDGPYTAPAEHFFDYEVCTLIAAGIGITPAAAMLRSVYFQWLHSRDKLRIKKVYLIWVYRDIRTLEWFKDLLIALSEEGLDSVVETQTYFTGQVPEGHPRLPAPDKDPFGKEVVATTIGTSSYIGRPDFDCVFGAVGERHPGCRIGTFLCGPKPMTRQVRRLAHKWDRRLQRQANTRLDFYSETF